MGRFKDSPVQINDQIVHWLVGHGFKPCKNVKGYTKVYKVDNTYKVWVTIKPDCEEIFIYKEYDKLTSLYGGFVAENLITIQDDWFDNLETFINEVDAVLTPWIG